MVDPGGFFFGHAMSLVLKNLHLLNFRSYENCKLDFSADSVIFCGPNGIGKSNLLEAIFFLSILRSFRTGSVRELVKIGAKEFHIEGEIARKGYSETMKVTQRAGGGRRLAVDQVPVRRSSEFIREFRAVAFVPEDKWITAGSSCCRRKFFDMFISVLEPAYLSALQRYGTALAQRNAALRINAREESVAAFEPELAGAAAVIAPFRRKYAELMEKKVNELLQADRFRILRQSDYPECDSDYLERLRQCRKKDFLRGFTTFGPQTDEFLFHLDDKLLRNFGSNGQLRLMSLYLKMAEFCLIRQNRHGVVALVDDVTGELDEENRERFLTLLQHADQTFYTFTTVPDGKMTDAQVVHLPLK